MYDSHVHSSFSADSNLKEENACELAQNLGLEGLIFTDHVDLDYPKIDFTLDFEKHHDFIMKLKAKHEGSLEIIKGIEVGIQPHVVEETKKILVENQFDFIIGSVHLIDGLDPYEKEIYEGKSKQAVYTRYLKEILNSYSLFSDFDVLGHFDFIIRFAPYEDRSMKYSEFSDLFDEIFKTIIHSGKGIEINTGSYRITDSKRDAVFDENILKRYKELGGEIVTLGSDAHSEEFIGYGFDKYKEIIRNFVLVEIVGITVNCSTMAVNSECSGLCKIYHSDI